MTMTDQPVSPAPADLLRALLATKTAVDIRYRLESGQGTDTEDGRAWQQAFDWISATPAPAPAGMREAFEADQRADWDDPACAADRALWERAWRAATAPAPAVVPNPHQPYPVDVEHIKRGCGHDTDSDVDSPEIGAAYDYVDRVAITHDFTVGGAPAWHGWALREAFLAGCTHKSEAPVAADAGEPTSETADLLRRLRGGVYGIDRIPLCNEAAAKIDQLEAEILRGKRALAALMAGQIEAEATHQPGLQLAQAGGTAPEMADVPRRQPDDLTNEQLGVIAHQGFANYWLTHRSGSAVEAWAASARAVLAATASPGMGDHSGDGTKMVSGWKPIETAPKDQVFLGWIRAERWSSADGEGSGRSHDVSQGDFCWWRAVSDSPDGGYFDNSAGQVGDAQEVTHWMPLPAAPDSSVQVTQTGDKA